MPLGILGLAAELWLQFQFPVEEHSAWHQVETHAFRSLLFTLKTLTEFPNWKGLQLYPQEVKVNKDKIFSLCFSLSFF